MFGFFRWGKDAADANGNKKEKCAKSAEIIEVVAGWHTSVFLRYKKDLMKKRKATDEKQAFPEVNTKQRTGFHPGGGVLASRKNVRCRWCGGIEH